MKIRGSSDKRGKDRLGESKNRVTRVKEPLERAPEARKGRPKGGQEEAPGPTTYIDPGSTSLIFGRPGPP